MKKFLIKIRSKYYFVPSVYTFIFSLLAVFMVRIDYYGTKTSSDLLPSYICMLSQQGSNILIMVIGSLITILTVAYSVIMIVLTIYGNQLSPRTVQDFLENRRTIRIMGYYTGVLVYSIISLFAVKINGSDTYIFAPTLGILFFIAGIIIFIYFMHLISKSLQTSIYIQKIAEEASDFIDKKHKSILEDPDISIENIEDHKESLEGKAVELMPENSGFIQLYDEKKLFQLAKERNVLIYCNRKEGEHIMEDEPYIKVFGKPKKSDVEDLVNEISKLVQIGEEPNLQGDIYNKTSKLVEIAVRALSPGVNDPATAVFCIDKIGFLLHKAVGNSEAKVYRDADKNVCLILEGLTFNRMLFDHFYQIKLYGIDDLKIYLALLSALNHIAQDGSGYIKRQIWGFAEYLIFETNPSEYPDLEKRRLYERYYQLAKSTGQKLDIRDKFKVKEQ